MATEELRGMVAAEVAASTKRLTTIVNNTPVTVFTVWMYLNVTGHTPRVIAPEVTADVKAVPWVLMAMLRKVVAGGHLTTEEQDETYLHAGDEWGMRILAAELGSEVIVRVPITGDKGFVVLSRQTMLTLPQT